MVFSSLIFLFVFLPTFFAAYYIAPRGRRNDIALIGSLFFYAWGAPRFVVALILSSILDYAIGSLIFKNRARPGVQKKLIALSVVANISLLGYFKYANFFVSQANAALANLGFSPLPWVQVALPVGISFFTFHKLSYSIDVFRGVVGPAKNFGAFLLYLAIFPQLIAGPIIRYHVIERQLRDRSLSWDTVFEGIYRFCVGLGKKVLIADALGAVADSIFDAKVDTLSSSKVWLGALTYSMQIYFDFSGYSDMAIGLGAMMGFSFPENFNRPYRATDFTDFWRRWHITLSSWMREYVYIPMGGNRVPTWRRYLNLWIVFLLSGLWHGPNWTFVAWGLYHGFFLVADKVVLLRVSEHIFSPVRIASTFFLIMIGWVFFRADSLEHASSLLQVMFSFKSNPDPTAALARDLISNRGLTALTIALLLSFCPTPTLKSRGVLALASSPWVRGAFALLLFFLSAANLTNSLFHPFIYFRF